MLLRVSARAVAGVILSLAAVQTSATELLVNGDFETGDFTGWSTVALPGSSGGLFVISNGAATPASGNPTVANPAGGLFHSVTDQGGPGTYSLGQVFTVPVGATSVTLSFDHFANNWAGTTVVDPIGLDHTGPANQHARVDLLVFGAGPFSTAPADILATFFLGADGTAPPYPWTSYVFDITGIALPGGSYAIRFAEVDNQSFFNQGVDNVSVRAALVPEPASWAMLIAGFGVVGVAARRRRNPHFA